MEQAAEAAGRWFIGRGAKLVVVTLGPWGALAIDNCKNCCHEPGATLPDGAAIDATGAGDAFIAGFLFAWLGISCSLSRPLLEETHVSASHLTGI